MAIGGAGRAFARSADEIAELLAGLRRRLTTPEWTGPGIEFTRPVPPAIQPPARPYRAEQYRARPVRAQEEGPRTVQFPREEPSELGGVRTVYSPEDVVPIRPEFLDSFDESVKLDPVRAQFELMDFLTNVSNPNELYRGAVLLQRIRASSSANRQMMRGLEKALEESALRLGIPSTQRMGPMYLFQYVSPEGVPPVTERTGSTLIDLRKKLRAAAGGSADKAKRGGFVRLSALEEWDSGANGGIIGQARAEGLIGEADELQLLDQLKYWRGQIYEGLGIDPASVRGLQGLKITDDMPEQEIVQRITQALRTSESIDEIAAILGEAQTVVRSSSYMDMIEQVVDAQVRRLGLAGEASGESLTGLRRSIYGQSDDLERGGIPVERPDEEFVTRRLPEGVSLYGAPPEELGTVLARVNERLRRLGAEPIERRSIGNVRPRRVGSAAREVEPMSGGQSVPISVEEREALVRWVRSQGGEIDDVPAGMYRSGDWYLPLQSGTAMVSAPSSALSTGVLGTSVPRTPVPAYLKRRRDVPELGRYDIRLGRFLDEGEKGSGFANIRLRPIRRTPMSQRAPAAQPASPTVSRETPRAPTPAQASRLGKIDPSDETQVFVFGSNLQGVHGAGAARTARDSWGAQTGVGRGLTGRSYALPTKRTPTREGRQLSMQELEQEFAELRRVVEANPDKTFMLSPVGTGLGGYSLDEIAALVAKFDWPQNFKIVDVNEQGAINFIRAIQRAKMSAGSARPVAASGQNVSRETPAMTMPMNFVDGQGGRRMREQFRGKSTMDLILEGNRTGTTRNSINQFRKSNGELLEVGDIIEVTDNTGRRVKVQVTKAPYQLPRSDDPAMMDRYRRTWSYYEGWEPSMYDQYIGKWQIQYKLLGS